MISHFLSSAHISLLTGYSAHPFWGLLPLGCLLLFKEMVTVITKTSLSSPGPSSATTESEPLEASQLLALAVGQRIVIAPIYCALITFPSARHFTCIILTNLHRNPSKWVLLGRGRAGSSPGWPTPQAGLAASRRSALQAAVANGPGHGLPQLF